jgi:acyl-CoA thioester hydrolase
VPVRVRYAETDAAGVVHHASYLVWFEEARSSLSRSIGAPYRELEGSGVDLVVVRCEVRYRQAARYDDEVRVWCALTDVRSRRCVFGYRAERAADAVVLATGTTEHLSIRRSTGRPVVIPEPFLSSYRAAVAGCD